MEIKTSASMMCANLGRLAEEVKKLEAGGIDLLHFDIMDAHFVPNLTLGPLILQALRNKTNLPFEAHLQLSHPEKFIPTFIKVGSDMIFVHSESSNCLHRLIGMIKEGGKKAGVVLNPATPLSHLEYLLPLLDVVIVMTVDPGFAGQTFIPQVLPKIKKLRGMIEENSLSIDIEVDGNINEKTIPLTKAAGANVFVAGTSSIFQSGKDIEEATRQFKKVCQQNSP